MDQSVHDLTINLDREDSELLRDILDSTYRDLKSEISDTDNSRFKQQLRERERRVVRLLGLVGGPLPDRSP